ncbi:hypothetical protein PV10_06679 [Exophiala mesophila]|uniref:Uncharacterized protein n=1 Tax=Exophiala mesophila TaxID=212818 RepID=A0A0D1XVB5_EXOME|nr:uncharacterized protein PV10_06679 [Exophiala mesophila]KIV92221.1 hypothetical protein PV10_06679 [Exophiala mesophila]
MTDEPCCRAGRQRDYTRRCGQHVVACVDEAQVKSTDNDATAVLDQPPRDDQNTDSGNSGLDSPLPKMSRSDQCPGPSTPLNLFSYPLTVLPIFSPTVRTSLSRHSPFHF